MGDPRLARGDVSRFVAEAGEFVIRDPGEPFDWHEPEIADGPDIVAEIPPAEGDAIDRLVAALAPTVLDDVEPLIEALETAAAPATSWADLKARLLAAVEGMAPERLATALAQAQFAARVAAKLGRPGD